MSVKSSTNSIINPGVEHIETEPQCSSTQKGIIMINLSIVPKPHFMDAMKIHREQGHQAFLDACSYNHNQALSYRAAKHRLLPLWIQRRKERAVWKHAFITLNKYSNHWRSQRQFLDRLDKTKMMLQKGIL